MDIFVTEIKNIINNVPYELLKQFEQYKISDKNRWNAHTASYLMSDRILKNYYNIKNRKLEFINKKPFLTERTKYLSISHSEEYIVLAFSDYDCGIDIEKCKPRNYKKISERMKFNCHSQEEFYFEWTKYEAEYKLNQLYANYKHFKYNNYVICACSTNKDESFELFIQSSNDFPNLIS